MGWFLDLLDTINENDKKKKQEQREKEYELYHLEDVEKEFVERGDYEPYNFEDSEDELHNLDEDDYYYEDK